MLFLDRPERFLFTLLGLAFTLLFTLESKFFVTSLGKILVDLLKEGLLLLVIESRFTKSLDERLLGANPEEKPCEATSSFVIDLEILNFWVIKIKTSFEKRLILSTKMLTILSLMKLKTRLFLSMHQIEKMKQAKIENITVKVLKFENIFNNGLLSRLGKKIPIKPNDRTQDPIWKKIEEKILERIRFLKVNKNRIKDGAITQGPKL